MVDRNFFAQEMERLREQFGDKFSGRKQDLIFLALRTLKNDDVSKIFDELIGNHRFAPTIAEIKEYALKYRKNSFQKTSCTLCDGNGIASLFYKNGKSYAFSCRCSNGALYPNLQKVTDINLADFSKSQYTRSL